MIFYNFQIEAWGEEPVAFLGDEEHWLCVCAVGAELPPAVTLHFNLEEGLLEDSPRVCKLGTIRGNMQGIITAFIGVGRGVMHEGIFVKV